MDLIQIVLHPIASIKRAQFTMAVKSGVVSEIIGAVHRVDKDFSKKVADADALAKADKAAAQEKANQAMNLLVEAKKAEKAADDLQAQVNLLTPTPTK